MVDNLKVTVGVSVDSRLNLFTVTERVQAGAIAIMMSLFSNHGRSNYTCMHFGLHTYSVNYRGQQGTDNGGATVFELRSKRWREQQASSRLSFGSEVLLCG